MSTFTLYELETPTRWKAGAVIRYRVVDDDFNRASYTDLIGTTSGRAPSYAHVVEEREPFYFDCADCGADGPEIHGLLAPAGITPDMGPVGFEDVGILTAEPEVKGRRRGPRPALFCQGCTARRTTAAISAVAP